MTDDDWTDEDLQGFVDDLFGVAGKWEDRIGAVTVSRAMAFQSIAMLAQQIGRQGTIETVMKILADQDVCSVAMVPLRPGRGGAPS